MTPGFQIGIFVIPLIVGTVVFIAWYKFLKKAKEKEMKKQAQYNAEALKSHGDKD